MENQASAFESLFEKTSDYIETRVELLKLQAVDKSSDVASSVTSKLIIVLLISFFLVMANIGVALLIGDALGKLYWGFFIVAGFYLLVGLIFYAFRNQLLKTPMSNYIVKNLLKEQEWPSAAKQN